MLIRTVLLCAVIVSGSSTPTMAQGWEVSILGGWTAPTFKQEFVFDVDLDAPGARQEGQFTLTAEGSFAFGGAVAYFFNDNFGIEGRIDTINVNVDTMGPRIESDVDLGPGFPPATAVIEVGGGVLNVERLIPFSLNAKARTSGRTRFVASGGLSYLPRVRFDAVQPVSVSLESLGTSVELARVVLTAGALADDPESRWGLNGGAGVEIDVSPSVSIVGDFRVHGFQSQTFVWRRSENPSSELEEILIDELEKLPPIEFQLIYFQVTGGIAFRF